MNREKRQSYNLLIAFIFIIMALVAISDNVRGVFIPSFKVDFSANNTQMGMMIAIGSLGYIAFSYIGGMLCEIIGQKKVMISGLFFTMISLFTLYISTSFAGLLLGMFLLNMGLSLLAIAINTVIPMIAVSFQAVLMNVIHFCYGVGATLTQKATGALLYKGIEWRSIYLYISIVFVIVLITFIPVKMPSIARAKEDKKIDYRSIFKNKLLYFYMIALGLYVSSEMATSNWFVNYMKEIYSYNENMGTYYTTLFFGTFTVGRLLGGFVVEKIGALKSVLISSTLAFVLYSIGFVMGQKGLILIAFSGLFFSIVFPTMILTVSKVFKKNSSYVVGIIITASSAISMGVNFIIGWLNDLVGVHLAYYTIPVSLFFCALFVYFIHRDTMKEEETV